MMKVRVGSLPIGAAFITLVTERAGLVLEHQDGHPPSPGGVVVSLHGEYRTLHPDVLVQVVERGSDARVR